MNQQSRNNRTPQRRPVSPQPQHPSRESTRRALAPQDEALVISEAQAQAIRDAEGYQMQAISGYDPVALAVTSATQGTVVTPSGQRSGRVVSRPMPTPPTPQDEEEYDEFDDEEGENSEDAEYEDSEDEIDEEVELDRRDSGYYDKQDAEEFYADELDDASAVDEASALLDDRPAPPPTAMPVKYSGWLDLGDQADPKYAIPYRGWKIKMRLDVSMGMLAAVEQLQDARQRADEWKRRTGRTINTVRVEHIRTILEDLVVAWNYVDENHRDLPQPPAGLRFLRPDLLAATLNRAMMEFTPSKKRSKRSTRR